MGDEIYEVARTLDRIHYLEDFHHRLKEFYMEHHAEWPQYIVVGFREQLERKQEQIDLEWQHLRRLSQAIAAGRTAAHYHI